MLERHKLLMGRTQDRAGQNNGSIGVFWRSFNGIIGHIRYMFRGLKITHNHEHSSLYCSQILNAYAKLWIYFINCRFSSIPCRTSRTSGTTGTTCCLLLLGHDEQANQSPTNSRQHVPLILTKITGTCCLLGVDMQKH